MKKRSLVIICLLSMALSSLFAQRSGPRGSSLVASEWENSSPFSGVTIPVVANATRLYSMVFPTNISVAKITYSVVTADNTGDLYDIGFYDVNGNLACHIGAKAGTAFAPSSSIFTQSFTSTCNLTGGVRYTFAITGNAATAVLFGATRTQMGQSATAPASNSTTSGGVLNSSITYSADSYTNSGGPPVLTLHN